MSEDILKNLAVYSAIKSVDKMTDNEKKEFMRNFEEELKINVELKEMYEELKKEQ